GGGATADGSGMEPVAGHPEEGHGGAGSDPWAPPADAARRTAEEQAAIEARIDAAWAARQAEIRAEEADLPPEPDTTIWLAHHWPADYDRCAKVGRFHICRRCLFMYPVAALAAVLAGFGWWWPRSFDPIALWLFPLPAVVDFVTDNLAFTRYSARRQAVLSAVGALAAGAGYHRFLHDHGDLAVWSVVATYCVVCGLAAFIHARATPSAA
ncbi:MAG TPA: hypothetical protein VGM93_14300, partial [Acidimicrobiales bacterium]